MLEEERREILRRICEASGPQCVREIMAAFLHFNPEWKSHCVLTGGPEDGMWSEAEAAMYGWLWKVGVFDAEQTAKLMGKVGRKDGGAC